MTTTLENVAAKRECELEDARQKYRELLRRYDDPRTGDAELLDAVLAKLGVEPDEVPRHIALLGRLRQQEATLDREAEMIATEPEAVSLLEEAETYRRATDVEAERRDQAAADARGVITGARIFGSQARREIELLTKTHWFLEPRGKPAEHEAPKGRDRAERLLAALPPGCTGKIAWGGDDAEVVLEVAGAEGVQVVCRGVDVEAAAQAALDFARRVGRAGVVVSPSADPPPEDEATDGAPILAALRERYGVEAIYAAGRHEVRLRPKAKAPEGDAAAPEADGATDLVIVSRGRSRARAARRALEFVQAGAPARCAVLEKRAAALNTQRDALEAEARDLRARLVEAEGKIAQGGKAGRRKAAAKRITRKQS